MAMMILLIVIATCWFLEFSLWLHLHSCSCCHLCLIPKSVSVCVLDFDMELVLLFQGWKFLSAFEINVYVLFVVFDLLHDWICLQPILKTFFYL